MKEKILISILIFLLNYQFGFCQENKSIEFNANDLIGVWCPQYNHGKPELTFEKKVTTELRYGLSTEILANGEFRNRYIAPCGNDKMLWTHNYSGQWHLNEKDWVLITTQPINRKGTAYKILELTSDKLVLAEINLSTLFQRYPRDKLVYSSIMLEVTE